MERAQPQRAGGILAFIQFLHLGDRWVPALPSGAYVGL